MTKKRILIGRSSKADISFKGQTEVSKIHCRLVQEGNVWVVHDGDIGPSLNGVWLMVTDKVRLDKGTRLKSGSYNFEVVNLSQNGL